MAVDMFLKLDGIDGESADSTHANEIDIYSWGWGMTQSGTTHVGGGGGGGKVAVGDLSITKKVDKSTTTLIKKCTSGTHIASGILTVRKAGGDNPVEYFILNMETIMVTSYNTGGSADGQDLVMEQISLNFRRFSLTYTPQDEQGVGAGATDAGWDIAQNIPWSA